MQPQSTTKTKENQSNFLINLANIEKLFDEIFKSSEDVIRISGVNPTLFEVIINEYCFDRQRLVYWQSGSQSVNSSNDNESISQLDYNTKYSELVDKLSKHYERVEKITEVGMFSVKGDQVTLWPYGYKSPIKISFFGDKIEDISLYDLYLFRSVDKLSNVILSSNPLTHISGPHFKFEKQPQIFLQNRLEQDELDYKKVDFGFSSAKLYIGNYELLRKDLQEKKKKGYRILIDKSIYNLVLKNASGIDLEVVDWGLSEGFENSKSRVLYLSKREILASITLSKSSFGSKFESFQDEIKLNDFIVHEDHGIGIYKGIESRVLFDMSEDYIIIEYLRDDKLYVPISQIAKISKYEAYGKEPRLTRLNSHEWKNVTTKVKKSIKVIASELMRLYAVRTTKKGVKFVSDNETIKKFEEAFEFVPTDDQVRCNIEIKADLESGELMDRLLVGDVGFGKTEIAMRAAMKAVLSGKQVAVIVPTTILALQHYAVFSERFKDFGAKVEYVSRFSKSENKNKIEELNKGKIDIIIGTHRLLSDDVKFKDLGLYIIDEEQKFGVKQKEKMKSIRLDVHVLSLSATPIPRSLYMSLVGLRDISILNTPPKGRKKVMTESFAFNWNKIVEIVNKEIDRGGQVYFMHNEVKSINSMSLQLNNLIPEAKIIVAHGQMPPERLEANTRAFFDHQFDILLCTTIIQNGIDVPNVNTIIINKSHKLGLSQLYQLRGRVGRSPKQAFCYLLYPSQKDYFEDVQQEKDPKNKISATAMERIATILDHQELGSGFNIASKDLELRGAGSILGYQQAGFVNAVGLNLYMQILKEEIDKLKNDNFKYNAR